MTRKRKRNTYASSGQCWDNLPQAAKERVENLFEKKFSYRADVPRNYDYLKSKQISNTWTEDKFLKLKQDLNDIKSSLNDKVMLDWHCHTQQVNIAGKIMPHIRQYQRPELCTQAWCKFYEIACTYIEVEPAVPFFSVHLCEAPGAFVTSLNQYLLSTGHKSQWTWLASTLNPYYEGNQMGQMVDNDIFLRSSHSNWYFGEDGTGDVMSECNLQGLRQYVMGQQVDLVTADGSIDCQWDPAEQENTVSRLQYCETLSALYILSPGGAFILKMFTMFECKTISLMYLLYMAFDKIHAFKPCTSKGGNSEVYIVCQGYKGLDVHKEYLDRLVPLYFGVSEPEGCIFSESDIPQSFLEDHYQCATFFKDCQMRSINRNLDLYSNLDEDERRQIEEERDYCVECFLNKYHIKPMVQAARIMKDTKEWRMRKKVARKPVRDKKAAVAERFNMEGKFFGNFHDRQALCGMTWTQRIAAFQTYEEQVDNDDNTLWIQSMVEGLSLHEMEGLKPVLGKPVRKVLNSPFCPPALLIDTQDLISNVKWLSNNQVMEESFIRNIADKLCKVLSSAMSVKDIEDLLEMECSTAKSEGHVNIAPETDEVPSRTNNQSASSKVQNDSVNNRNCNAMAQSDETDDGNGVTVSLLNDINSVQGQGSSSVSVGTTSNNVNGSSHQTMEGSLRDDPTVDMVSEHLGDRRVVSFRCVTKTKGSEIFQQMESIQSDQSESDSVVWLYTVTQMDLGDNLELHEQLNMCTVVLDILKDCPAGGSVVIEMGTSLTRVMAALVYTLYRSFAEIGFVHHHGALLRRHLVCVSYQKYRIKVQDYLRQVMEQMNYRQSSAVLEILPVNMMLEDYSFTQFLRVSNSNLLQSFITTVIQKERAAGGDIEHEKGHNTETVVATWKRTQH